MTKRFFEPSRREDEGLARGANSRATNKDGSKKDQVRCAQNISLRTIFLPIPLALICCWLVRHIKTNNILPPASEKAMLSELLREELSKTRVVTFRCQRPVLLHQRSTTKPCDFNKIGNYYIFPASVFRKKGNFTKYACGKNKTIVFISREI